jgi:lysophospholipase L1-like esterase
MRIRLIIFCLSTAFFILLALLVICNLKNYKDRLRHRLDPLEEYRLGPSAGPVENAFWIIGDSRAADWPPRQLGFIRIPVSNLGIRGQTSRQVLERFSHDLDRSCPTCILIQVGINDLKSIGLLEDPSITGDCIRNIRQILDACEEHDIKAIYSAIFPPGDVELFRRPFWKASITDSLVAVNEAIRESCRQKGFIYFDTHALLEDPDHPGKTMKAYQSDFLHINDGGYQLVSEALMDLLGRTGEDWVEGLTDR